MASTSTASSSTTSSSATSLRRANLRRAETFLVPTTWIFAFDGTLANQVTGSPSTVIETILKLIDKSVGNIKVRYCKGVGTAEAVFDKYIGGGTGRGVRSNVIEAFQFLVDNYRNGDTIILVGYSRGLATARGLACLIDRIGIPDAEKIRRCQRDINECCRDLYSRYVKGELRNHRVAAHLRKKYNSNTDVRIKLLCGFDTVTSIGLPKTGLFRITKPFRFLYKRHKYLEFNPSSVVEHCRHAISLHEIRAVYDVELMQICETSPSTLKQVYFLGNHSDLGWEKQYGGLIDIPLAWMIQQLQDCAGIAFDEGELLNRFPQYNEPPITFQLSTDAPIVHEPILKRGLWLRFITGYKARLPGTMVDRCVSNEQIHPTVRLRGYGATTNESAVPRHHLEEKCDGTFAWTYGSGRRGTAGSGSSMEPQSIPEAELGKLEGRLLGIRLPRNELDL